MCTSSGFRLFILWVLCILAGTSCGSPSDPSKGGGAVSITIEGATATMEVGTVAELRGVVRDQSGNVLTGQRLFWTSDNTQVLQVGQESGSLRAITPGVAKIGVACCGSLIDTVRVGVLGPPATINITPATASMPRGEARDFTATVRDVNAQVLSAAQVTWSTADASIATVNAAGRVTGLKEGAVQLIASTGAVSASAQVHITAPAVATVDISPKDASVAVGQTAQLQATLRDQDGNALTGRPVAWNSRDSGVLTVDQAGRVTGVKIGVTTVEATSENRTGSVQVSVTAIPVATVEIEPANPTVQEGGKIRLTAVARDETGAVLTGRPVSWSSSAPATATMNAAGELTGVLPGTAEITATVEGKVGRVRVTVTPSPVASVTVEPSPAQVNLDGETQLTVTLRDASNRVLSGRVVTWSSASNAIARVSASGIVTGVAVGEVTVTAAAEGKVGTTQVSVIRPPIATLEVMPGSASVSVYDTVHLRAVARDASGNILSGRPVAWSSSNSGIASVSGSGIVSGVTTGNVVVTATSEGKDAQASVAVNNPVPTVTGVSPDTATAGRPGLTITVHGSRFVPASRVRWNGDNRETSFVNESQLQAVITAADLASAGTAQISVMTTAPGGGTSSSKAFQVRVAGTISVGDTVSGSLASSGEVDRYTFSGKAGQEVNVFFQAMSGDVVTTMSLDLIEPLGSEMASVTSSGSDKTGPLVRRRTGRLRLPSDGNYRIEVSGSTGDYRFHVYPISRLPERMSQPIQVNTEYASEDIYLPGDADEFTFFAFSGQRVQPQIQLTTGGSTSGAVGIQLVSPSGTIYGPLHAQNQGSVYSLLTVMLTETGTYRLVIFDHTRIDTVPVKYTFEVPTR